MHSWKRAASFCSGFEIALDNQVKGTQVVSITGAGGKTSLLFYLAEEAKALGKRVLVTTTTRIWVPAKSLYDYYDCSGHFFQNQLLPDRGCVCVAGDEVVNGKLTCSDRKKIELARDKFDLVLVEADGAKEKPLKGWNDTEPVIPEFTDLTIGVLDISSIGLTVNDKNIHRLDCFCHLTGAVKDSVIEIDRLLKLVRLEKGLLQYSRGRRIVYLSKMEEDADFNNGQIVKEKLSDLKVVGGSVVSGALYV